MKFVAAVDEVASETQLSEGWTYVLFPESSVTSIDAAVSGCTIRSFHGKKFKKAEAPEYRTLLNAVRREFQQTAPSLLVSTLLDTSWKNELVPFGERLISNAFALANLTEPEAIQIGAHLFPGLITLQRLIDRVQGPLLKIEIDSDNISKKLRLATVEVGKQSLAVSKLLTTAYNAYRKKQFPRSPKLEPGGLFAVKDARSRVVQVADVFGNFTLAYAFVKLGNTSKTRVVKATILEDVFGDILDPSSIRDACKLVGDNDIQLNYSGGFTLRLGQVD